MKLRRRELPDPMQYVADTIADHVRARRNELAQAESRADVIAWITVDGLLWCAVCIQPTEAAAADMLPVRRTTDGTPEPCDLCGRVVRGEA